jgi:GDP-mannose 6-dehydrogenase
MTRISIFGLGYVGSVSSACLAAAGHDVIGVDLAEAKVRAIGRGESPIVEEGLSDLMAEVVASGRLRATTDVNEAIAASDVSLICVGTPSLANGSLDLGYVERVSDGIGRALAAKGTYHVVVVRSTMLPGSTEARVIPTLERHLGPVGGSFSVCYNPEFLREGSSIRDFYAPPYTIVGGDEDRAVETVASIYSAANAPVLHVSIREAEMLKYVSNAFHALKIAFANEIGLICKAHGIDSHRVMELFGRDTKLNISTAYLRPGYAFGGSCLPKDLRALVHRSRSLDLGSPVLEAIIPSNDSHIATAFEMIRRTGLKRVGFLGLSFKAGTDDLRESPLVTLVERLIGRGFDVRIMDPSVSFARIHGANRAFIEHEIPHIVSLMVEDPEVLLDHAEVLVIGNGSDEFRSILERRPTQHVIDLVRLAEADGAARYDGIAW